MAKQDKLWLGSIPRLEDEVTPEVTPEETREMLNSVNELIQSELNKEIKKNKDIKFLEKELDKKNKELEKFRNE